MSGFGLDTVVVQLPHLLFEAVARHVPCDSAADGASGSIVTVLQAGFYDCQGVAVHTAVSRAAASAVWQWRVSLGGIAYRPEKLSKFYQTALDDLKVLQRSALMNRLYEGEKLVVEKPRLIIGGGGAGQEAAVGGGGQPTSGPQSSGGALPARKLVSSSLFVDEFSA